MSTTFATRPTTIRPCGDCGARPRQVYRRRDGAWIVETYCRACATQRHRRAKGTTRDDAALRWARSSRTKVRA